MMAGLGDSGKTSAKNRPGARCQWLTSVTIATQEAESRRIKVQSQPRQIAYKTLSQKKSQKWAGGVAQVVGPEFKPQY
jgi:hypothetical protein